MATSPTTSVGKARDYLRTQLADSATFRTLVGAATQAAALTHIHYDSLPRPASSADFYSSSEISTYWPYAVIWVESYSRVATARSTAAEFDDLGVFGIQLVRRTPDAVANDPTEASITFENIWAKVMEELDAVAGQAGYLDFKGISAESGPLRSSEEEEESNGPGDEQWIDLMIAWGTGVK